MSVDGILTMRHSVTHDQLAGFIMFAYIANVLIISIYIFTFSEPLAVSS